MKIEESKKVDEELRMVIKRQTSFFSVKQLWL
jgi:hypothetical protein